jgi:folate-binding protein YgfZ
MVTNNVRDLAVGHGVYAFLLNAQGRILGDLYAYNRGEAITVDTDRSQAKKILETFDHYIIMDDVEVKNLNELTTLGIAGSRARQVLSTAGFDTPEMQPLQIQPGQWRGFEYSIVSGEHNNYEVWIGSSAVRPFWDALLEAGATPVGFEAVEVDRIESGIPVYGVDIRDRDLPQETEQARALNFNKGCYVGQEIVERIRSRGAVHRKFTGFIVGGTVAAGSKVAVEGKDVGEITSVAGAPTVENKFIALGYIRREIGTPGREVTIGGTKATVVQLPLSRTSLLPEENSLAQRPA